LHNLQCDVGQSSEPGESEAGRKLTAEASAEDYTIDRNDPSLTLTRKMDRARYRVYIGPIYGAIGPYVSLGT